MLIQLRSYALTALCSALACAPLVANKRPNIVFLFSDDHACQAISAYPGGLLDEIAPTPGIDRLAKEGLLFKNSFCANSICGPSRACILTGKHSHLNGFLGNNGSLFDGHQQTFPSLLQKAGYKTAVVGKWHLGTDPVGFDYWEILPGQGSYYNPDLLQMDHTTKRYQGHCNDVVTKRALNQLEQLSGSGKPFVLMAQYKAPHRNWSPAERHLNLFDDVTIPEPETLFDDYANRSVTLAEHQMGIATDMSWGHDLKFHGTNLFPKYFTSQSENREYARMDDRQKAVWDAAYGPKNEAFIAQMKAKELSDREITQWKHQRYLKDYLRSIRSMDEGIALILAELDASELTENTIVIYSSDQGFYLGEHGWFDKRWMFEESFKMPLIVRWPGVIKPGSTAGALVQNIDYAPTFLEAAGVDVPQDMQGQSLVPLLKSSGKTPYDWRESLYYRYYGERAHHVAAHDGIRTDRYKLMHFPDTNEYNLFDLVFDPQEMKSLHDDPTRAEVFTELQSKLTETRVKYHAHSAVIPALRNEKEWWRKRNENANKSAKKNQYDLIFVGDSLTQGWERNGKDVWADFYQSRNSFNLGFSGDRTEHVLSRFNSGNLHNQEEAKAVVIMIGTNNTGHKQQDPSETAEGITRVASQVRARCPKAKILLLGVLPRGEHSDDPLRKLNLDINEHIAPLADGERIHYLDMGSQFLDEDGRFKQEFTTDFLHLTPEGYQIWADAIEPKLKEFGL